MIKELVKITGRVMLAFAVFGVLVAGVGGIVTFFIEDGQPLWHPIAGGIVVLVFSVFWTYMRTHAWSD